MTSNASPNMAPFAPITLEGSVVRLEPLRMEHAPLLWEAAKDDLEEIFRFLPIPMDKPEEFPRFVELALDDQRRGLLVAFATVERKSGSVVGSTRFMNIEARYRRVEIGCTWIAPKWQRTAVNTEAKYLMLRHAFENCGCLRVGLTSDALNQKSRKAILRIGAKEEGTLRKHIIMPNGRVRDTVCFSILDSEWPEVKARLEERLR